MYIYMQYHIHKLNDWNNLLLDKYCIVYLCSKCHLDKFFYNHKILFLEE